MSNNNSVKNISKIKNVFTDYTFNELKRRLGATIIVKYLS